MAADYSDLKSAIERQVYIKQRPGLQLIDGDERSPMAWIFDFRALLLQPEWLNRYAEIFWEIYESNYPFQVCGMETAAISIVAAIVMKGVERGTPVNGLYIRKSRKRVGLLKQIEGTPDNTPVILVDDLINSGSTFNKQIKILSDARAHVTDIFALIAFASQAEYGHLGPRVRTVFTLNDFNLPLGGKKELVIPPDPFATVWKFAGSTPLRNIVHEKSSPVIDGTALFIGSDAGEMLSLNQSNGSLKWKYKAGTGDSGNAIFSTPLVIGDSVFFGSVNGRIVALNKKNGDELWHHDAADRVISSFSASEKHGLVFAGLEFGMRNKAGGVIALQAHSGKAVWDRDLPGAVHAMPLCIPHGDRLVVADDIGNVSVYELKTGHIDYSMAARGGIFGNLVYDEMRCTIYFGTKEGVFYAVHMPTGEIKFAKETLGIYSTPLIGEDAVYFSSLDKKIYAVDIDTGSTKWTFATQGRVFASPTMVEGSLWCGSNDGKLYELDPATGNLRSVHQFSERIVNPITYNPETRLFYVPTQANEVYCLRKK